MTTYEFELIDHGIQHPQYFQGCGTACTSFQHVVTGIGDNPREALDDALERIAQIGGIDTEALFQQIIAEEGDNPALVTDEEGNKQFPTSPSAWEELLGANGFSDDDAPDDDDELEGWEEDREEFQETAESNFYHISIRFNVPYLAPTTGQANGQ